VGRISIAPRTAGISPNAVGTLIGGETSGAGNVISSNTLDGIDLGGVGSTDVPGATDFVPPGTVLGNIIGADATGAHNLGNGGSGIAITDGGTDYIIGGTDTTAGNVIAFNAMQGVSIDPASNNPFTLAVGSDSVAGNSIFSNGAQGIWVNSGTQNQISQNSVYSNHGLGIQDGAGASAGNSCQANTNGGNGLQNAPVLTAQSGGTVFVAATATDPNGNTSQFSNCVAVTDSSNLASIVGSLNSLQSTTYTIEFFQNSACDPSGFGQGQTFLNRISVKTSASCTAGFTNNVNLSQADLGVSLSGAVNLNPGPATFTSVVTNHGSIAAASVVYTFNLPSAESFVSATATQGSCSAAGNALTCTLGAMPSGATAEITVNLNVATVGNFANTVNVSSPTPDPSTANNTATLNVSSTYAYAVIDHLSLANGVAGTGALALTIYGDVFYQGATIATVNNTPVTSTFLANQTCGVQYSYYPCQALQVTIPTSLTASPGTLTIGVSNPAPGGNSSGGPFTQTFTIYPNPGTVTQFQLTGVPNPAQIDTAYNLAVVALDTYGNVVPGYRGIVNLGDSFQDETFDSGPQYQFTAADNGSHVFSTTFTVPIAEVIGVSDAGTPAIAGTLAVAISPVLGPPAALYPTSTPGSVPIGYPFQPLTVNLTDATDDPLPGVTITFSAPATGASGTFPNGQTSIDVVTDQNGNAQAILTANQTAGMFTVNVIAGSTSAQFPLISTANLPAHLTIEKPQDGSAGGSTIRGPIDTEFLDELWVLVTDSEGNPVNGVPVTLTAPTTGASVNLSGTTTVSGSQSVFPGVAIFAPAGVANATAGAYSVTAAAGTLSVQFSFTNTSPAKTVTQLSSYQGTLQAAAVRMPFATPLIAIPLDANGECLAQVPVTFSAPASGPSATFSAQTVLSDPNTCYAQVTAIANGVIGGPYNITAAAGGVTATFSVTNVLGTTTLTPTAGATQATQPGAAFPSPLQVTLLDAGGNPLAGRTVNFMLPTLGASATLSASSAVTNSSGVAQITATANGMAGSYAVTALFGSARATFTLANVTPGNIVASGGTPQSTATGAAFPIALQATVTDAGGNPIAGMVVNFSAPTSGASATLSAATATTNAAGVASVTATANGVGGAYLVTAGAGALKAAFSLTNNAFSPCDVSQQGSFTIVDAQQIANQALGVAKPTNDLNGDGIVNSVDLQIVINAVLKLGCSAP
jgi:parallel beta-helix repeat protein